MAVDPSMLAGLAGGPTGAPADASAGTPSGPPTEAVTSRHSGDALDPYRTAIMSLQHCAELEDDDQDLVAIHKAITLMQQVLARNAKDADQAGGITPTLRHVRR